MTEQEIVSRIKAIDLGAEYSDSEMLTMLLYDIIPGYPSKKAADELILRYGSLFDICNTPYNDLRQIMGVGESGARILKLTRALVFNILRQNSSESRRRLVQTDEIVDYLRPYFVGAQSEMVYAVLVNAQYRHIHTQKLGEGSFDHVPFDFKKLMELIIRYKATGVIISHNHNGSVLPSAEDTVITNKFNQFLIELDLKLVDHIIFCENSYKSMRESGYIKDPKQKATLEYFPK